MTKDSDGGITVSGAKIVATGSALTHATFVAHHRCEYRTEERNAWIDPT